MFFPSVALVAVLSTSDAALIEDAYARWQALAGDMKSLHVEYTLTQTTFGRELVRHYTLRAVRTSDGLVADLSERAGDTPGDRFLLRDGTVHLVNEKQKSVTRFPTDDTTRFLADHFHPFLVLLDRERAAKAYSIAVEKRDEWFTYLALKPKDGKSLLPTGVIAFPHRKNDTLPVGVPAAVSTTDGAVTTRWDVTKWVMNGDHPPKAEEFALPSEKDGWTISEWTWPPKWKTK